MDKEADAGDHAEHDEREVINAEGEVGVEVGDGDPGVAEQRRYVADRLGRAWGLHGEPEPDPEAGGDKGGDQRDSRDERARRTSPDGPVDEEPGEGKQRNQPEIRG